MKKVTLKLDKASIDKAIREVEDYEKWMQEKAKLLCEKLAILGAQEASVRFASAMYDGVNDTAIDVEQSENGWTITANGQASAFIEFGTGIYHNPSEPYPIPRPPGIVGIGEYGKGYGKRRGWKYKDPGGNLVFTRGGPAVMPMWYATQEMRNKLLEIAREVFAG